MNMLKLSAAAMLCTVAWPEITRGEELGLDDILSRVRQATGVLEFTACKEAIRLAGTGSFLGSPAETHALIHPSGAFVFHQNGSLRMANSYDGRQTWRMDMGGEIYPLSLGEREQTLFGGFAMSHLWFDPRFQMLFSLAESAADEPVVTLAFTIEGQLLEGTVEISRTTWLPTRWSAAAGTEVTTWTFTGVAPAGKLRLPAQVAQTAAAGSSAQYDFTSARATSDFNMAEFALGPASPTDAQFDPAAPAALETRRARTGHVLVRPLIDGEDRGWFIFDTGAGINVLDTETAAALRCREVGSVPAVGAAGAVQSPVLRARTMQLGPMTMEEPLFIGIDFSGISAAMGEKIAGVIGFPVIWRSVTEFDAELGSVSLHEPLRGAQLPVQWAPLTLYQRHSCLPARFEGHEGIFVLDTGAGSSSVLFHAPATERLELLEGRETTDSMLGGVGGFNAAKAGVIKWFELAGVRFDDLPARFAIEAKGAMADAYLLGNIGGGLLKGRVLFLDYQRGRFALVARDE